MMRWFRKPRVACLDELPMTVATATKRGRAGLGRRACIALACGSTNADKYPAAGLDGFRATAPCMRFTDMFLVTPNV